MATKHASNLPGARWLFRGALCLGLVLPAGLTIAALPGVHGQAVYRSGVDLVHFGVTVVDRRGDLITDLSLEDFEIIEAGVPQRLEYFARGSDDRGALPPLHLGLLFDTSGSMRNDLQFAQSAAIRFINALERAVDITLVKFDDTVRVTRYSQADRVRLVERIRLAEPDGWTALYDALGVYIDSSGDQRGDKVLVLYTDGGDTRSAMTFDELLRMVRVSDVTIYAIGLLEHQLQSQRMNQRMRLQQLADASGGQAFFPRSSRELDQMYGRILGELESRYHLGYASTDPRTDGAWRQVEVRLVRPDLRGARVRTRGGYFAPFLESASER